MPNKLIRVGLHLEMMKFQKEPDPTKRGLSKIVKSQNALAAAAQHGITEVGIRLSYAESRALFAVESLLDGTDYKGNTSAVTWSPSNLYEFEGESPVLEVSQAEFYEAYGVTKTKTKRKKMEYSSKGSRVALAALMSLSETPFLIQYERKFDGKGAQNKLIEVVHPLFDLAQANGKLKITPIPPLVDQIDTYFVWKPKDLFEKVIDSKSPAHCLFIEWLLMNYEMNRRQSTPQKYILNRRMENVAYAVGLGRMIRDRKRKELREKLNNLYEFAKKIDYLKKFQVDVEGRAVAKMDVLHLNAEKFAAMRK